MKLEWGIEPYISLAHHPNKVGRAKNGKAIILLNRTFWLLILLEFDKSNHYYTVNQQEKILPVGLRELFL